MFQCPICGELLEILTNNHCVNKHYLTKKELIDRFGTPKYVTPTMSREVQNWIRESTIITRMDFDIAQAAARSQRRG